MLEQCPQAGARGQDLVHKQRGARHQEQGLFTHSDWREAEQWADVGTWVNVALGV